MARRRLHIRRFFGVALLVAALLALLELNQLLPGGWPGGGGRSAFRSEFETGDDAMRLRAGTHEARWPSEGITVTVRRADGTPGEDWHLDLADGRRLEADGAGRVRLGADDRPRPFFGVTLDGGGAAHTPADPSVATEWVVHLPSDAPPRPPSPATRTGTLTVLAAESQAPLPGAEVDVLAPDWSRTKQSDDQGQVLLALLPGPQEVVVGHPDRRTARIWLHPDRPGPWRVALEALRRHSVALAADVDGNPAAVERARVLAPDGTVLFEASAPAGEAMTSVDLVLGDEEASRALFEVGGGSFPFHRVPLATVRGTMVLSAGRRIEVQATDPQAQPLRDVRLTAYYVPAASAVGPGLNELVEVVVSGRGGVRLPAGVSAEVQVEAAYSVPRVVKVGPDEKGPLRVKLEPAFVLPVTVADEAGRPLVGATVIVRAEVDDRLLERTARTDAEGRASVPELPATGLEVYAHAKGHAWGARTAQAARQMAPIAFRLPRGRPIRLVTETPLGIPLDRVRVRAEPVGDGVPDVVPPHAAPWLTDASGGLVLPDLRDRPYRVLLSHPDMLPVELGGVVPGGTVHFVTLSPR